MLNYVCFTCYWAFQYFGRQGPSLRLRIARHRLYGLRGPLHAVYLELLTWGGRENFSEIRRTVAGEPETCEFHPWLIQGIGFTV